LSKNRVRPRQTLASPAVLHGSDFRTYESPLEPAHPS